MREPFEVRLLVARAVRLLAARAVRPLGLGHMDDGGEISGVTAEISVSPGIVFDAAFFL